LATEELDLNDDAKKKMGELTKLITYGKIVLLIDMALKRSTEIKSCPIPQLPLEMLVVEWCGGKEEAQQHNSTTAQEQKKEKYEQQITTSEQKTKTANTITSYELPVTNHETKKNEPSESTTSLNSNDIAKNPTEPKKTIIECVKELVTPHADISLADVQSKWKEVISVIEVKTPSLSFILKMAELRETQHDTLILAVPYSFHRDKLMEKPVRHNLETILSELLNAKARVDVIIEEKNVLQPANEDLQALASALGGEVIN
jgi:DNA polymerase III gamma/tau subunit